MKAILEKEIMEKFVGLACRLSPENLSCDGEASRTYVNQKLKQIRKEWKALEKQLGKKMDEDDVWAWDRKREDTFERIGK